MTYVVGVDFGTLSARALVLRAADGEEMGSAVHEYPHAVMERTLASSGAELPPQWALQDPSDYVEALQQAVPAAVRAAGIRPDEVVGSPTARRCARCPASRTGRTRT
jgi:L-ribulokinase